MGTMAHHPLLVGKIGDLRSDAVEEMLDSGPPGIGSWARLVAWESRLLWILSGSSIVVSVCNYMISFVTLVFVGHLGVEELAGASITSVGIQGLAYGVMGGYGVTTSDFVFSIFFRYNIVVIIAVQTVCGQAYGAKKYSSMGLICQRAIVLHLCAALLFTPIYWYSGTILRDIGQSAIISAQGQAFARGLIPQLYAFALACPMQRFLQAQNVVNPLACMSAGVLLLHALLVWVAVRLLDYGVLGAGLVQSLSWWIIVVLNGLYIVFSPSCKETWTGLSVRALSGIWPYFKLTMSSAVMLCLEIWSNQALVLISGYLPNPTISLDVISICMYYWTWDMEFMLGLSAGTSVRVSNELGAGHPLVAKFSVMVVTSTTILISVFFTAMVLVFRSGLGRPFSSGREVIEAMSGLSPLLAVSILLNGIQPILSGVAIGSGWQALVAYVNLTTYYVIGLPIGVVLGFKAGLGVAGIWWGLIIGVVLQTIILVTLTLRTNWNKEVEKAKERLQRSANEENLLEVI